MHYIPGAGFIKSPMFRPRSYSPTYFRRSYALDDDALIYPVHIPRKNFIDTSAEESYLRSHVNKELYFSGAALEDTFDLASQSRSRDQQLLSKAHKAIVNTQLHSSPRYAVVSRRAARSQSVPPSDLHRKVMKEVVLFRARAYPYRYRYLHVPPASTRRSRVSYPRVPVYRPRVVYRPRALSIPRHFYTTVDCQSTTDEVMKLPSFGALLSLNSHLRSLEQTLTAGLKKRSQSAPNPPIWKNRKAALVGSKVDIVLPEKRRPKSLYAQSKMRQLRKEEREQVPGEPTEGLKAHRPFTLTLPPQEPHKVPMTSLRRKIRRVIASSHEDPNYFRK